MARRTVNFLCQNCGADPRPLAGQVRRLRRVEHARRRRRSPAPRRSRPGRRAAAAASRSSRSPAAHGDAPRLPSGMAELDRVTGGGFVRGSVLLLGGDPGIGKSTLLIQATAALARAGHRVVYISGEEAVAQVRLRAERLGLADAPVELAAETAVEDIIATLSEGKVPRLVVIDSIQTMWTDAVEFGARHRDPGARLGPGADPLRQALGRDRDPGRPRHQGRPDRRPPRGRAHGRRGDVVRGRRLAPVPHSARGEEPLRPDRRDRRVRDDRARPARGRQSVRTVPVGARPRLARHRRLCRHRRHAAGAGGNSGAGGADVARHAAPRGRGLGPEPAVDADRRAGGPLRRAARRPRRLSQRRRRPAGARARGGSRGRRGSGLLAGGCAAAVRRGLFRRGVAVGRGATGGAGAGPDEGGPEAGLRPRRGSRGRARGGRRRARARQPSALSSISSRRSQETAKSRGIRSRIAAEKTDDAGPSGRYTRGAMQPSPGPTNGRGIKPSGVDPPFPLPRACGAREGDSDPPPIRPRAPIPQARQRRHATCR